MSAFDLLARAIGEAINGRKCWIPDMGHGITETREYVGLVKDLSWAGLQSLDGQAISILEHHGDPKAADGLIAMVLVSDRVFPVEVNEWTADDGEHTSDGCIAAVYPDVATMERYHR